MRRRSGKAQAVVEMALFGSLILVAFGALVSYVQRQNDQQYVQMEAFRRALANSCTFRNGELENPGASVQMTLIQRRRQPDLSSAYMKGSFQTFSASSNVFWAVPEVGENAENLIIYRVNEDEKVVNSTQYEQHKKDAEAKGGEFQLEAPVFSSGTVYNETAVKEENRERIVNRRQSFLQDTVTTTIPYNVVNNVTDTLIESGELWEIEQGLFRDADDAGQYKYSNQTVGNQVERGKEWVTRF